jgi:hypothetical protein
MVDRVCNDKARQTRRKRRDRLHGFAAGQRKLRSHRCRHAAQSIIAIGDFASKSQLMTNVLALAVTVVMALALPDIRNVLTRSSLRESSDPDLLRPTICGSV